MIYKSGLIAILALTGAAFPATADPAFWTVSGDPANSFVPDQFSTVELNPPGVATVATLGDGSLGFNGGLTIGGGGALYAIANDSNGAGSLFLVQPSGNTTLIGVAGGLGHGFLGGLTWYPKFSTFYAAVLDNAGNTTLASITSGGVASNLGKNLGTGFSGLAFDTANGLFYGIGNDDSGYSTLYSFSFGGAPTYVTALGFGFGALTYDAANDVFWAISPVNNSGSQLFQITPAGAASPDLILGDGFVELAVQPASVPEPSVAGTFAAGLVFAFWLSRGKRRSNEKYS